MSMKAIIAVIIISILIGVLYVLFEKNFSGTPTLSQVKTSSSGEKPQQTQTIEQSSISSLPTPEPTLPPIDSNSNLLEEGTKLEMRDYSSMFEDLKSKVQE